MLRPGPESGVGSYLDAPVPNEKPPPAALPPADTVPEPSVPVPKENPVDMAVSVQLVQHAETGPARALLSPHSPGHTGGMVVF